MSNLEISVQRLDSLTPTTGKVLVKIKTSDSIIAVIPLEIKICGFKKIWYLKTMDSKDYVIIYDIKVFLKFTSAHEHHSIEFVGINGRIFTHFQPG